MSLKRNVVTPILPIENNTFATRVQLLELVDLLRMFW